MMRRLVGLILVGLLVLSGCGLGGDPLGGEDSTDKKMAIVVATVPEQERTVLAHIYAGALRDLGYQVSVQEFDSRQDYLQAIVDDEVQVAPDYSGELLLAFDQASPATTVDEEVADLNETIDPTMAILTPAATGSHVVWLVRPDIAEQEELVSLDQLSGLSGNMTVSVSPDLAGAPNGIPGLAGVYDVSFDKVIKEPDSAARAAALRDGDVDLISLRSTDPAIDKFVALDDTQGMDAVEQRVIPVIRRELPDDARERLNELQAKLDDEQLLALTADGAADPEETAAQWLAEAGLG